MVVSGMTAAFVIVPALAIVLGLMDWQKRSIGKVLLNIVLIWVLQGFCLFGSILFMFNLHAQYYSACIFSFGLGLAMLLTLLIWKRRRKVIRIISYALMAGSIVCFVSMAGYQAYLDHIPTVGENPHLLSQYEPFQEDTMAVTLSEESALKLTENLPLLDGATALYPIYASFVQNAYPVPEDGYNFYKSHVRCSKTGEAYERLIRGEADMIFVAGPSQAQLETAKELQVEFKMTPIGKEAFVFFVNSKNPVDSLTLDQIRGIYSGAYTNWNELGGKNQAIQAFQRDEGSGSQTAIQNLMGGQEMIQPIITKAVGGMGGIIEQVGDYQNYKNAIGFSFRFYATEMVKNDQIKLLKIDGIEPTEENIHNGTYPLASDFYAITAESENPNVQPFLDWILSDQGQELVEKVGYTPVR